MLAIKTVDLGKNYRIYKSFWNRLKGKSIKIDALKEINLEIKRKEIFGLLGPNGAGKTTFMNIISTLLLPDTGEAKVFGLDVIKNAGEIRKIIALSSAYSGFYSGLTVKENLKFYSMLYDADVNVIDNLISLVDLKRYRNTLFEELSAGNKQKVTIAKSLLGNPKLLLMDELTVALDPKVASDVRRLILKKRRKNKTTILLATHNMQEAEELCDRVAIIHRGTIRACGKPRRLKKLVKEEDSIEILVDESKNPRFLLKLEGVNRMNFYNSRIVVHVDDAEKRLEKIIKSLISNKYHITSVNLRESSLEDVFLKLTGVELE
jgi:ABC-2 type transport system ATP-binding protein